jgi:phosphoribosylformimino-5-aminoimidazole carboxamide ribotide isomerase
VEIYPAIDIRGGQVVRASRTDPAAAVVYDPDPFAVADRYVAAGARWVHVVDLDRAFGLGDQRALVAQLVKRLAIPVQLGGGLWRHDDVMAMRDAGVQRVVLGVRALADPRALRDLVDALSEDCLALAVDGNNGRGWSRDWPGAERHSPAELARAGRDAGVATVVYTDLAREGRLGGASVPAAAALARTSGAAVVVSGGVDSLAELAAIRDAGLAGAVVGRALFEHRFTLPEALACCS